MRRNNLPRRKATSLTDSSMKSVQKILASAGDVLTYSRWKKSCLVETIIETIFSVSAACQRVSDDIHS